jgi:DNA-binding MarR family transcriptional regulator
MSITTVVSKSRYGKRDAGGRPLPLTASRPELLINGSDQEFRHVVHGLLAFSVRIEAVREGFAAMVGLTGIQYTILISVSHLEQGGEVSVTKVAEHLHVSGAFVTIECGKLVKLGLLTKLPDPRDRRRVCLNITAKGSDLLQSLAPTQSRVNDVLFGFLDATRFQQFSEMVDQMSTCGDQAIALLKFLRK